MRPSLVEGGGGGRADRELPGGDLYLPSPFHRTAASGLPSAIVSSTLPPPSTSPSFAFAMA